MTKPKAPAKKAAPARKPAAKPAARRAPAAKKVPPKADEPALPAKKQRLDREALERDFRVGKLTYREMAEKHGITPGRITQLSGELGWIRGDLKTVVNAATQSLLVAQMVDGEVNKVKQGLNQSVLAAAELNTLVISRHRVRAGKAVDVAMRMLDELDTTTTKPEELRALFEQVTADMSGPALQSAQQQFREFMRVHNRIGSVQKLMAALKDAQVLEAQAYGNLYEVKKGPDELELLSDDELDARLKEKAAKLGL